MWPCKKRKKYIIIGLAVACCAALLFCFPYWPVMRAMDGSHRLYYEPCVLSEQQADAICKVLSCYGETHFRVGNVVLIPAWLFLDKEILCNYTEKSTDRYKTEKTIVETAINKFNTIYSYWDINCERDITLTIISDDLLIIKMDRKPTDALPVHLLVDKDASEYMLVIARNSLTKCWQVENFEKIPSKAKLSPNMLLCYNFQLCSGSEKLPLHPELYYDQVISEKNSITWKMKLQKTKVFQNCPLRENIIDKIEKSINFRLSDIVAGFYAPLSEQECSPTGAWLEHDELIGSHIFISDIEIAVLSFSEHGIIQFNNTKKSLSPMYIDFLKENSPFVCTSAYYYDDESSQLILQKRLSEIRSKPYMEWLIIRNGEELRAIRVHSHPRNEAVNGG